MKDRERADPLEKDLARIRIMCVLGELSAPSQLSIHDYRLMMEEIDRLRTLLAEREEGKQPTVVTSQLALDDPSWSLYAHTKDWKATFRTSANLLATEFIERIMAIDPNLEHWIIELQRWRGETKTDGSGSSGSSGGWTEVKCLVKTP